jgi:hypothetical protein
MVAASSWVKMPALHRGSGYPHALDMYDQDCLPKARRRNCLMLLLAPNARCNLQSQLMLGSTLTAPSLIPSHRHSGPPLPLTHLVKTIYNGCCLLLGQNARLAKGLGIPSHTFPVPANAARKYPTNRASANPMPPKPCSGQFTALSLYPSPENSTVAQIPPPSTHTHLVKPAHDCFCLLLCQDASLAKGLGICLAALQITQKQQGTGAHMHVASY